MKIYWLSNANAPYGDDQMIIHNGDHLQYEIDNANTPPEQADKPIAREGSKPTLNVHPDTSDMAMAALREQGYEPKRWYGSFATSTQAPAAAQVGEQFEAGPDECDTGVALTKAIDAVLAEDTPLVNHTIERCAQVVEAYHAPGQGTLLMYLAAAIRKLKDEPQRDPPLGMPFPEEVG